MDGLTPGARASPVVGLNGGSSVIDLRSASVPSSPSYKVSFLCPVWPKVSINDGLARTRLMRSESFVIGAYSELETCNVAL